MWRCLCLYQGGGWWLHLQCTSWVCLNSVIPLILSSIQSDQNWSLYIPTVSANQDVTCLVFSWSSGPDYFSASFFSVIFWNCFSIEVLSWWCCMLRLFLGVSKYHHQAHFSVRLVAGLYFADFLMSHCNVWTMVMFTFLPNSSEKASSLLQHVDSGEGTTWSSSSPLFSGSFL